MLRTHIQQLATEHITWKFLPASAPWTGGAYERLIEPVKSSLHRCLRANPICGPTQFRTLIAEIENAVNSRPLMSTHTNDDFTVLTPNDFLGVHYRPTEFEQSMPTPTTTAAKRLREISRNTTEVLKQFWDIWTTAYLQTLRERPGTMTFQRSKQLASRNPKVGDVVIIKHDVRKRSQWQLGKITNLNISEDDQVRSARLQVGSRTRVGGPKIFVTKPLQKLYFLEMNENEDQNIEEEFPSDDDVSQHSIQLDIDF